MRQSTSAAADAATRVVAFPSARRRPQPAIVAAHLQAARNVSPPARAVLLALVTFTDKSWSCWPAVSSLVQITGLHPSTVYAAVRELMAGGLLTKRQRRNRPTVYTIQVDDSGEAAIVGIDDSGEDAIVKPTIAVRTTDVSGEDAIVRTEDPTEDPPDQYNPPIPPVDEPSLNMKPAGALDVVATLWARLLPAKVWRPFKRTAARRKQAALRLAEYAIEEIESALIAMRKSSRCRGEEAMNRDGGVWKASIDWFLREDRIAWLNEGRFANRGRHGQHVHDADANDPPVGQVVTDPKCKHLFQFRGRCKVCGLKV